MSVEKLESYITNSDLPNLHALLAKDPSLVKSRTSHQVSPLMLSCYYKKPEVTVLLLKHLDEISLFEASAAGKLDVVAHLVRQHPEAVDYYAEDGFTPLGLACYFGQFEIARLLVTKGADVNLPSNNGFRVYPLHSAAAGNYTEIARMLIESNAQVNVKQQAGVTALTFSCSKRKYRSADHAARTWRRCKCIRMEGGKLPADLAREKGFVEIAEALA